MSARAAAAVRRPADVRLDDQVADWGVVATYSVCHGEPRVAGSKWRVRDLVEQFQAGLGVEGLAKVTRLTVLQVENALRYAMLARTVRERWLGRQLQRSAREGT